MSSRLTFLICTLLLAPLCWGQGVDRITRDPNANTVIGPRNLPLHAGAKALLAGDDEQGVKLTLKGLEFAQGKREHEAALSNLCAGYIKLGNYKDALNYCNLLLKRNDKNWRGYNNRAVAYIRLKQWENADQDLKKGEELNPGASTIKVARSLYMDALHPVRPEIEIDDRKKKANDDSETN